MQRKLVSLALTVVMAASLCTGLSTPAKAKAPESEEDLLSCLTFLRNGSSDEKDHPFSPGLTVRLVSGTGSQNAQQADYSVFSGGSYWEISHSGGSGCYLACELNLYQRISGGSAPQGYRRIPEGSGYLYDRSGTFARVSDKPGERPMRIQGGETAWFSSVNLADFLSVALPGTADEGDGQFLYEIVLSSYASPASVGTGSVSTAAASGVTHESDVSAAFTAADTGAAAYDTASCDTAAYNTLGYDTAAYDTATAAASFRFQLDEARTEQIRSARFSDVTRQTYCYNAVHWAFERNITRGTSDSTFSPNSTCSTAQIMTFLWRYQGQPKSVSTAPQPFRDVVSDAYYAQAAAWAGEKGIVRGSAFHPSAPCTRAAAVTYLYRLKGCPPVSTPPVFADVPSDADYAAAVVWAVDRGITKGTSDTTFSPDCICTRGQIVTFLYRYWQDMISGALSGGNGLVSG